MTLKKLTSVHTIDVLKPIVTQDTGGGVIRNYAYEKTLKCNVQPRDAMELFDTSTRVMMIPHRIYFSKNPMVSLDRRIQWKGVGNDMLMRITAIPYNVNAANRLWEMRANSRTSDNPDKQLLLTMDESLVPPGYVKIWEEVGDALKPLWCSPEQYAELLHKDAERRARKRGIVPMLMDGMTVAVANPAAPREELTAVERAIQIYLRDPNQSLRTVAQQAGCNVSLLSRDDRIKRLREAHAGTVPRGSKSEDGVEAEDWDEE